MTKIVYKSYRRNLLFFFETPPNFLTSKQDVQAQGEVSSSPESSSNMKIFDSSSLFELDLVGILRNKEVVHCV
jgi:hypothetical protein